MNSSSGELIAYLEAPCYVVFSIVQYKAGCRICAWISSAYGVQDFAEVAAREHQRTHIDGEAT